MKFDLRNVIVNTLFAVTLFVYYPSPITAVPFLLNYTGTLSDNTIPVSDGLYTLKFALYKSSTAVTALWSETQNILLNNGIFSAVLGSIEPFPKTINNYDNLYLGIKLESDPEFIPRHRVVSNMFAIKSEYAATSSSAIYAVSSGSAGYTQSSAYAMISSQTVNSEYLHGYPYTHFLTTTTLIPRSTDSTFNTITTGSINNIIMIDGTTYPRSSAGIIQALNSLPSTGGTILLSPGTYPVSESITITKSNLTLTGCGNAVILKPSNNLNAPVIQTSNTNGAVQRIIISNISVDGNRTEQSTECHGVYIKDAVEITLRDCVITNCFGYGIFIESSEHCKVTNVFCNNNSWAGICLLRSNNNILAHNNCRQNGIGIYTMHCQHTVISSNNLSLNTQYGISIYGGGYCGITNNSLLNDSQESDNYYTELFLWGDGEGSDACYCVVSGNTVSCTANTRAKYGIAESTTANNHNIFTNNIITGARSGQLQKIGVNSIDNNNVKLD
ncbi:MAG: right-handed parallel beta-helix repeat-containing protein [Elusimicrobiota bacterium]